MPAMEEECIAVLLRRNEQGQAVPISTAERLHLGSDALRGGTAVLQ